MACSRSLHLVVVAVTTLAIGALAFTIWRDRETTREETESSLREVARLLEEHTHAALLVGDAQIARIRDALDGRPMAQIGTRADQAWLKRLCDEQSFVDSAWIFDAAANMRVSSRGLPPGGMNVADRSYYTSLRDGAESFISPLIWGRLVHNAFVVMSRRLDNPDGSFAGGIEVSLTSEYFTEFYRSLNPGADAIFVIYRDDGSLVMRSTLPPGQETFAKPARLLSEVEKASSGVFTTVSELDGVERLYAYRRMDGRPLIVATALPLSQVYAAWRERTQRSLLLATAGLMSFWMVAAMLARTLRREAMLRARAEDLLADKTMLFQEIHHRVKNNLQIIASFLTMQAVHSRDAATAAAFEEALSRLQSMGLIHQILYEQNEATEVAMDAYLRALGASIGQTFGAEQRGISIEVAPSDARLAMDQAVPLALLANEALTNALKHAFPAGQSGCIRMELRRDERHLAFSLADDGIGMPEGAKSGLGMVILKALARQLGGTLDWAVGPGTRLTLTVPPQTKAA